jgi:hypothetical protein
MLAGSAPDAAPAVDAPRQVTRRHVFYIGGFDPRGPAHYHRLYRDNALAQAAVMGASVTVGEREKAAAHASAWSVAYRSSADQAATQTRVEFLRWDDIVRAHWPRNPWIEALDMLRTAWLFTRSGAFERIRRLDWRPYSALVFPPALLLFLLLILPLLNLAIVFGARLADAGIGWAVGMALALDVAALGYAWLCEHRLRMRWLMRTFVFSARQAAGEAAGLEERIDAFALALRDRCRSGGVDEVLLVGHSLGTMLAPSVLARALGLDPGLPSCGPRLSLLTLGQCSELLSLLPQAGLFRRELGVLARTADIDWIDVTSPADYCAMALVDPVAVAGQADGALPDRPKLLSPRFAALFSAKRYAAIKSDPFRMHFQYIMASELPGDYDYFAITAGAQTLGARFAAQRSVTGYRRVQRMAPPQAPSVGPRGRRPDSAP